ncbi:hypothetical protein [Variovorax sp. PAMC26660]|uniref:hypothetical protein n=1 Tax=Variovorax sp. PAMC26660 TaxID=2762322 RepID=UPI00164E71E4|nr:hypothetical protein [Variovorax sp. PAMC26660]QNK67611.1 hypothetical protein H7F35_31470 [Variovorax sp. PAMC26660]
MKKSTIATAILGLLGAIVTYFTQAPASEKAASIQQSGTVAIGNGNRLNNVTIVNQAPNKAAGSEAEGEKSQTFPEALVGRWKGVARYVLPEGEIIATGYTRFQQNGAYNFSGECIMRIHGESTPSKTVVWTVSETGTWRAAGKSVSITSIDLKSLKTVVRQTGQPDLDIDRVTALAPTVGMPPPPRYRLEDLTPRGGSQEYSIVELTETGLRTAGKDLRGNNMEYVATRQP